MKIERILAGGDGGQSSICNRQSSISRPAQPSRLLKKGICHAERSEASAVSY
jgi:hypothetical protein